MQIFLSHSNLDEVIAQALGSLLENLFGERVEVKYSSDQDAGGGIPPGEAWLPWITQRITEADKTFVLLTPNSLSTPWVLWEAGAAAGVALATNKTGHVVPIRFGVVDDDVPGPFKSVQAIAGDSDGLGGITRMLRAINHELNLLSKTAFDSTTRDQVPVFLTSVRQALMASAPMGNLLGNIPEGFSAEKLSGVWATSYKFLSKRKTAYHADLSRITAQSTRRVTISNRDVRARTSGRDAPFQNEIDAELVNRHLVGQWRNLSDTRYFGMIQLAIHTGENSMEGYYTGFDNDVTVTSGSWRWVRIDPKIILTDVSAVKLAEPRQIFDLLGKRMSAGGVLQLSEIVEGA